MIYTHKHVILILSCFCFNNLENKAKLGILGSKSVAFCKTATITICNVIKYDVNLMASETRAIR